jgi:dGTPase
MQVLGHDVSDFHRTRLTHSLEVAQIGRGIVSNLQSRQNIRFREFLPDQDLIEAVCLAHDLGHPPFGHAGEKAIDRCIRSKTKDSDNPLGFEGNGQTLRIVSFLEPKFHNYGLNLTRRTQLGLLKYPVSMSQCMDGVDVNVSKPPKCYLDSEKKNVEWILACFGSNDQQKFTTCQTSSDGRPGRPVFKSLDCSIMDVADEIAYATHDLDDAVYLGLIDRHRDLSNEELGKLTTLGEAIGLSAKDVENLFSRRSQERLKVCSMVVRKLIEAGSLVDNGEFTDPILSINFRLSTDAKEFLTFLNSKIVYSKVVKAPAVRVLEIKAEKMIEQLYNFIGDYGPEIMPDHGAGKRYKEAISNNQCAEQFIADYIASMTDRFCSDWFKRAFEPDAGGILDRL